MRTLIVEDEPKNIKILRKFLTDYFPEIQIVGEATSIQKAKEVYYSCKPDLLVLDVELTAGNAFDLLDELMPVSCEIIFVTAYDEHALKAFKYSAIDYLLKPVNIDELKTAIEKAKKQVGQKNINNQLKQLIDSYNRPVTKIAIPTNNSIQFINVNEIMYCKANGNTTYIHVSSNKVLLALKTIGEYVDLLPKNIFFRVHNSFLINMNFINKYIKGRGGILEMQDGKRIEVATRRKDEFLARFNN